jgi:hypothetical protein
MNCSLFTAEYRYFYSYTFFGMAFFGLAKNE